MQLLHAELSSEQKEPAQTRRGANVTVTTPGTYAQDRIALQKNKGEQFLYSQCLVVVVQRRELFHEPAGPNLKQPPSSDLSFAVSALHNAHHMLLIFQPLPGLSRTIGKSTLHRRRFSAVHPFSKQTLSTQAHPLNPGTLQEPSKRCLNWPRSQGPKEA